MQTTKHEIWCGDCLELLNDIADKSVDMVLCDLPYGTTACKWDTVIPFEALWTQYKRVLIPTGAILLTASQPFTSTLVTSNLKGFKYSWVWEKNRGSNFASTKYQPMKEHEDVLVFAYGKTTYNPQPTLRSEGGKSRSKYVINPSNTGKRDVYGGLAAVGVCAIDPIFRCPRSIIKFNTEVGCHPTQKPVALFEYLICTYTNAGATVLDNCCGSGTTGVAAYNTNRNSIQIDISQEYCDIARKRLEDAQTQAPANPSNRNQEAG
jgi:site-specific DNA-methyltransferase (adenine-specific)